MRGSALPAIRWQPSRAPYGKPDRPGADRRIVSVPARCVSSASTDGHLRRQRVGPPRSVACRRVLQRRRTQSPASPMATRKAADAAHGASSADWPMPLPSDQRVMVITIHHVVSDVVWRHKRARCDGAGINARLLPARQPKGRACARSRRLAGAVGEDLAGRRRGRGSVSTSRGSRPLHGSAALSVPPP